MEGYYEPEWSECDCWRYWEDLEDWGVTWFVGRLPLLPLIRAKLSRRFLKLDQVTRFRDLVRCLTGFHPWMNEEIEPGRRLCGVCFESEKRR